MGRHRQVSGLDGDVLDPGPLRARGASEVGWSDVATLFRTLLQLAESRVRITTAYFVPTSEELGIGQIVWNEGVLDVERDG